VLGADPFRCRDAFVGEGRQHPDIGQDGIGGVLGDRLEQRVGVAHGLDELDVVDLGQQHGNALAHEVVVLSEDDS
jgi:hypothetical protein